MADIELCYLSATEALERFRAKTLSPVELMVAVIARAEEVEPKINAFTFKYYDEAMHARTATPEFSIAGVTWSEMWCSGLQTAFWAQPRRRAI